MIEEHLIARDGYQLAAFVSPALTDNENAPWIVLSNSLGATWHMWDPQIPYLNLRYNVLAYDTRGHGASEAPEGPYAWDELVADTIAVMDAIGVAKASFMGLSLGGMTALGLARDHADRFDRIVCCDARADSPPAYIKGWDDRIALIDRAGVEAVVEPSIERWLAAGFRAANPDIVEATRAMIRTTSAVGYKGCAAALQCLDYQKDLPNLTVPMLYVVGSDDMGAPADNMQAMAQVTPGAQFVEIPGGAHLPNLDNATAFNKAIAAFLGIEG
jgi:3-oxoadipate enol-lactonase